ncbi:MAG TPA: hypothetical protein VG796_27430 [Verrucomicrobiales bacterium]|jgi:hypothetical protein|nr:hypothetical protein [Verrucomicrobiales bacterium]
MKTNIKAALLGAFAASVAFVTVPALLPPEAKAQETEKVVVVPAGPEQYKFISLAPFTNDASTQRMEDLVNKLAADGWKVRTGVGISLVLAK